MANKEPDLELTVGAVADKKSAKQATKDLTEEVENSIKGGRIEVPVDITVPIDKTKTKLTKAQNDITSELSKMMTKGFSASGKDIDALVSKFNKFTEALDAAGKGRQNKVYREIRKQVEELQKSHRALRSEMSTTPTKVSKTSGNKKSKKTAEDRYLDKQEEYSRRSQRAGKRKELYKELDYIRENKSPSSLGNRIIRGVATEQTLQETEYAGSYPSGLARQMAKSRAESRKRELASLKVERNKEKAEQRADALTKSKVKHPEQEENELKRDVITNELAKILGGIEHKRSDVSIQSFKDYLNAAFKFNEEANKNNWKVIQETLEKTLNRYRGDKGTLGITDGTQKGVFEGHSEAVVAIQGMLDYMKEKSKEPDKTGVTPEQARQLKELAKINAKEANKYADELLGKGQQNKKSNTVESNSQIAKEIAARKAIDEKTFAEVRESTTTTEKQANIDKIENVREAISDSNVEKTDKENKDINRDTARATKLDETTGFNTDSKSDELIDLAKNILNILQSVLGTKKPDLSEDTIKSGSSPEPPEELIGETEQKEPYENKVQKSNIYASPFRQGFWKKLEGKFESLTGVAKGYEEVLRANAEEQDKMAAERIKIWGMNNGRNPNDTGDIAAMRRVLQLYRSNKSSIENNPELMQKIKLTPGVTIDTTEITKILNEALSGKQMRNAQTGGGFLKNAFGFMTGGLGYAFMPSLEKTRAQADGLNQMFANINESLQSVLTNIQTKETELAGMEKLGQAKFDKNGYLTPDSSSAAFKTLADLEEEKWVLDSIIADLAANDEIIKKTSGRFPQMVKYLKFTSPVLKENNGILRNINSGLDKNGKALKFQSRLAEILNYTYQLMSRHIGQMIKSWITMANPINLIKKVFSDFGSYNVKWQRTMNVVKYNIRTIFRPFMEWIAQQLVNIIGFFDIISMKVQKAFGRLPVSLFDQAAADSEKINEELEAASNVSAGFDELHDIGPDNTGANDLLGEIYKLQLSKEWEDLANKIGDLFAGIITGDLGFSEVMLKILDIAWSGLKTIVGYVGKFLKDNIWPLIKNNWLEILAWVGGAFLAWKFLKTVGSLFANAIFGKLTPGFIGGIFTKVGGWIVSALNLTSFGKGVISAFSLLFGDGKYSLIGTIAEMFTNSAAITEAGSWGSMIGFAITKGLLAVLGAYATYKITDFFGDKAVDTKNYNLGLEAAGGDKKDKKSNLGNIAGGILGGIAGGAFTGGVTFGLPGAVIGAAIGAIAGTLQTVLRPALEETQVAARNMNNEIQNISYYEGQLQGISSQVQNLTELQNLMSEAVEKQTDRVYKQGEELGISRIRLDELVKSTQDGTFSTDLLSLSEQGLSDSLLQLSDLQDKNKSATEKLTEAKKKLQKAETDLAIAQDVAAGNFELAAARIEVAYASELYDIDEATKKMVQIVKEGSAKQATVMLKDMSPDLQAKFQKEYSTTEDGLKELTDLYFEYSKDEREYFLQNLTGEVQAEMQKRVNAIKQAVENAPWWKRLLDIGNDGKIFGKYYIDVPHAATGTNYVASDGLAYIHKGEAIIPKKYNPALGQSTMTAEERAYMVQMMNTMKSLDNTMKQGIPVSGQFVQRGSDLVAVVNKTKSQSGADLLSNVSYAR